MKVRLNSKIQAKMKMMLLLFKMIPPFVIFQILILQLESLKLSLNGLLVDNWVQTSYQSQLQVVINTMISVSRNMSYWNKIYMTTLQNSKRSWEYQIIQKSSMLILSIDMKLKYLRIWLKLIQFLKTLKWLQIDKAT